MCCRRWRSPRSVLTIHTVLRPLGRLLDLVPTVKTESIAGYTVLVEVRRTYEPQLRAQLMQELGKPEVTVRGLAGRAIHGDSDSAATMAQLRVPIEVEGKSRRAARRPGGPALAGARGWLDQLAASGDQGRHNISATMPMVVSGVEMCTRFWVAPEAGARVTKPPTDAATPLLSR